MLCLLPHLWQLAWIRNALYVNGTSRWQVGACACRYFASVSACPSFRNLFPPLSFIFSFSFMFFTSNLSAAHPPSAPGYVNAVVLAACTVAIRALLFREHAPKHGCPICECQRVNAEWGIINASPSWFSHQLTNLFTASHYRTNMHQRTHKCTNEDSTPKPWTTEDTPLLGTKLQRINCTIFSPRCVGGDHHATLDSMMKLANDARLPRVALPILCRPTAPVPQG